MRWCSCKVQIGVCRCVVKLILYILVQYRFSEELPRNGCEGKNGVIFFNSRVLVTIALGCTRSHVVARYATLFSYIFSHEHSHEKHTQQPPESGIYLRRIDFHSNVLFSGIWAGDAIFLHNLTECCSHVGNGN